MKIDPSVWCAGFVFLLVLVYLAAMWVAHKRVTSALCILLGHKFKYGFGGYVRESDTCRRCRFPENIPWSRP